MVSFSNLGKFIILVIVATLTACVTTEKKNEPVVFMGRQLDLSPYFSGFPYSGFKVSLDAKKVFYFHDGDKKILKELSLEKAKLGLYEQGRTLSDIDFSKRNFWSLSYNPRDKSLYWVGDENNNEVTNFYRMNLESLEIEMISKVRYVYGYQFNKDYSKLAYVARVTDGVDAKSEVHIMDLKDKSLKKVGSDGGKIRYYWGQPTWSDDEKNLVVSAIMNNDRNKRQLVHHNTVTGKQSLLLSNKKKRATLSTVKNWVSSDHFLYTSDEAGMTDIYLMNVKSKRSSRLTRLKANATGVHYQNERMVFVASNPIRSEIFLWNKHKDTFKKTYSRKVDGLASIADVTQDGDIVLSESAYNKKVHYSAAKLQPQSISSFKTIVAMQPNLLSQLVYTQKIEDLEYETFDIDPKTKKLRKIKALLYHPKKPLAGAYKAAMVQSFYGYSNRYRTEIQILQQAGFYVLTPAPRGSSGLGREFYALNDKDLGGNEIIDVIYAGKFLRKKLNMLPKNMGVFGHSHGGYAAMRLMTFPGEVNGNKADFPWGFGIAGAGFSDIAHFYRNSNIPTWVIKEAGDPDKEPKKIRSRSPLYNTQHFRGRILITHGSNDRRVPVEGSRQIVKKLKEAVPDRVVYKEWKGQGHSIKGVANQVQSYADWLNFLESSLKLSYDK